MGCSVIDRQNVEKTSSASVAVASDSQPIKVDVAIANKSNLISTQEYIGTTKPVKEVIVRSQVEGRLLNLTVDVGDTVRQGQQIGSLDDGLLAAAVERERAELANLESELNRAEIQVKNAEIQLQEALIELEQANNDATRYQDLAKTGSIAQQQAESYITDAKIAQKAVLSAKEAVNTELQAVSAAKSRIASQKSTIAEAAQRQTYAQIYAPLSGVVTEKFKETGSLVRSGEEIITVGDLSLAKVVVSLSELDLGKVFVGQEVKIELDAFGRDDFAGKVSRIAPTTADSVARQIPVEITLANPDNRIKGGLLARVDFQSVTQSQIVVPESAIVREDGTGYLFTVDEIVDRQATVNKKEVTLGDRNLGKVEILSGIKSGEKFVLRSSQPLQDKDEVALSIISDIE